jgi:hypothetical protein
MSRAQQKLLYQAEAGLWGHGRKFSDAAEVAVYLDSVITSEWFVKEYGWVPSIDVIPCRKSGNLAGAASKKDFYIYINTYTENVALHELAHLLCPTEEHCVLFVNIFKHLIRNAMGFYAWAEFSSDLEKVGYYAAK